jgi:hypothetical protein
MGIASKKSGFQMNTYASFLVLTDKSFHTFSVFCFFSTFRIETGIQFYLKTAFGAITDNTSTLHQRGRL